MKIIVPVVVVQLLGLSSAVFSSSGRFAINRRRNDIPGDARASTFLRFHRRCAIHDCDYATYNDDAENMKLDRSHESIFETDAGIFQDSAAECTGRFAMEYERERNSIRSAENAHIQQHQRTQDDNADGTISRSYRLKPATTFHTKITEDESEEKRCPSRYHENDLVFV